VNKVIGPGFIGSVINKSVELYDQVCSFLGRMRGIKFRAWHKHFKQMSNTIMTLGDTYFGFPNRSELRYWLHATNMAVMQFTGVKDKDGKEIYEGDIVRYGKADLQIIFEDGAFKIGGGLIYYRRPEEMKVIGNIYENPELLKAMNHKQLSSRGVKSKEAPPRDCEPRRQRPSRTLSDTAKVEN
jgi:hypothetical protein